MVERFDETNDQLKLSFQFGSNDIDFFTLKSMIKNI